MPARQRGDVSRLAERARAALCAGRARQDRRLVGAHQPAPAGPKLRKNVKRDARHKPVTVLEVAQALPPQSWRTVSWRAAPWGRLSSPACACAQPTRIWCARRNGLLIEWPHGEAEPRHYCIVDAGREDFLLKARLQCHGTLDDRAQLPGTQIRARPLALLRPQLARLPSSRNSVHCRLRLAHARTSAQHERLRSTPRPCHTQRLPAAQHCISGSAKTRSP